jgi:hypothetical protein
MIALMASAATLLATGCQKDKHLSKVITSREATAVTRSEVVSNTDMARQVKTAPAIAVLEKLGGMWQVDEQNPDQPVVIIDLSFKEATDAEIAQLKSLTRLEELYLIETKITDACLANVKGFADLRTLDLARTHVTDQGIAHLEGLSNLRTLGVSSTKITDAVMSHLKLLSGLQILDLSNTEITDAAVKKLQHALPKVQILR